MKDEYAKWSYGATKALFNYFEELEQEQYADSDTAGLVGSLTAGIELDVVAIRCDWNEYDSAWEAMQQYQPEDMPTIENSEGMSYAEIEEAQQEAAREWLEERTTVLDVENIDLENHCKVHSILVQEF